MSKRCGPSVAINLPPTAPYMRNAPLTERDYMSAVRSVGGMCNKTVAFQPYLTTEVAVGDHLRMRRRAQTVIIPKSQLPRRLILKLEACKCAGHQSLFLL